MLKCIIALLLVILMLSTGCTQQAAQNTTITKSTNDIPSSTLTAESAIAPITEVSQDIPVFAEDVQPEFINLNGPNLLQYVKDNIYSDLIARFDSEDYIIEDISAIYISEEYLEEVSYNSKTDIYFGHTLEELDAQFQGTRYIFSFGENGETAVEEFSEYGDVYNKVIKNVAVGTGVILVCVTASVVSGGVGASSAVSMIFASAAKTGTAYALSTGTISAVTAGVITGVQTGDFEEAKKAAALAGSESFKWGAITGIIVGRATKSVSIYHSASTLPTSRKSELTVLERTKDAFEQIAYRNGVEVPLNTLGTTRPDVVVKNLDGTVKAIEVKNYNLAMSSNRNSMISELERQITSRTIHLPPGSTQEIVLDVRGRGFSNELIDMTVAAIRSRLNNVYLDIPITVLRY